MDYNQFKESLLMGVGLVGKQSYFTKESVKMQTMIFLANGKITEVDKDEILELLYPTIEEFVELEEEIVE